MAATVLNTTGTRPDWYSPETGICRSKHPSVKLPEDPFLDAVSHIFSFNHNVGSAFTDASSGYSISYSEIVPLVNSVACGLHRLGISQGDVVLLLLPNSIYYPVIFLGVLYLGGIVTTMNPLSSGAEIRTQIASSGACFAFATVDRRPEFKVLGVNAVAVPENVVPGFSGSEFSDFYDLMSNGFQFDSIPRPTIKQDDPAAIMYSSGTTGVSKGVVLTHRNLISMVELFARFEASQYGSPPSENVYLAVLPMFHIYGLSLFVLGQLSLGSRIIVMRRFDVDEVVKAIDKYGVTHFPVVPPILKSLTKAAKGGGSCFRSLKQVSCGAASLNRHNIEDFVQTFPHVDFIQGYGMTETTAVGTRGFNTENSKTYSSIGLLAPNMQAKVVDWRTGSFMPPGQKGELWLRGPAIMKGYLNDVKGTMLTVDEDGWLRTGDIVHFDQDGFLHILDRLKDTIKYKGFQLGLLPLWRTSKSCFSISRLLPADLEAILTSHPEIVDVAVAGVANEESGEIPVAFVIRRSGSELSEEAVIDYVSKEVAPYKKVRKVVFVSSIPKSPAGKVLRRELKKLLTSRL